DLHGAPAGALVLGEVRGAHPPGAGPAKQILAHEGAVVAGEAVVVAREVGGQHRAHGRGLLPLTREQGGVPPGRGGGGGDGQPGAGGRGGGGGGGWPSRPARRTRRPRSTRTFHRAPG